MLDLARNDLTRLATDCRLSVVGVTGPEPFETVRDYLIDHVERGHLRGMDWFTAQRAVESTSPTTLHSGVRSIVSVAVPFWNGPAAPPDDGVLRGRIARYAWGRDYHTVLRKRMQQFVSAISDALGREVDARTLVDTARIVDRAAAARAGTGWYGKNSMIIVPQHGSWVMLGEMLLDIDILPDLPLARDCGRCSICIEQCPTGAIVEPYRIDAPRCISYLTIEERGAIPLELRPLMGVNVFGCDICQDVCPYTGAARPVDDVDFAPRTIENAFPSLQLLAGMSEDQFRSLYSGTAVTRAKRRGLARNAAIALGNSADPRAEPILRQMLVSHDEPLVRGHAAWALRHLCDLDSARFLSAARLRETDPIVRDEIEQALAA